MIHWKPSLPAAGYGGKTQSEQRLLMPVVYFSDPTLFSSIYSFGFTFLLFYLYVEMGSVFMCVCVCACVSVCVSVCLCVCVFEKV